MKPITDKQRQVLGFCAKNCYENSHSAGKIRRSAEGLSDPRRHFPQPSFMRNDSVSDLNSTGMLGESVTNHKFCRVCQTETERYASGGCKPCMKAYKLAWKSANPEKERERAAIYTAANAEKKRAIAAAYYAANREKVWARIKAYRLDNPEKYNKAASAYRAAHPEYGRISKHNRRARLRSSGGNLSKGIYQKLFKLQRGKCACCGLPLEGVSHLDHIMPLALGGSNTDDNVQLLRPSCNFEKSAKHPVDFMRARGFLL